jgi:hypothetical protein
MRKRERVCVSLEKRLDTVAGRHVCMRAWEERELSGQL